MVRVEGRGRRHGERAHQPVRPGVSGPVRHGACAGGCGAVWHADPGLLCVCFIPGTVLNTKYTAAEKKKDDDQSKKHFFFPIFLFQHFLFQQYFFKFYLNVIQCIICGPP